VGTLWEDDPREFGKCWDGADEGGHGWYELHPVDFIKSAKEYSTHSDSLDGDECAHRGQSARDLIALPLVRSALSFAQFFETQIWRFRQEVCRVKV